jgi:hypothetical protein
VPIGYAAVPFQNKEKTKLKRDEMPTCHCWIRIIVGLLSSVFFLRVEESAQIIAKRDEYGRKGK